MSMVNGAVSSKNLMISKSSSVEVPLTFISIQASLPHRVTSFPLKRMVPPRGGLMAGFPIASQVLSGIMFSCTSSSRVQSMSKSPILYLICSFSLNISDSLTCQWSFKVSFICSNIFFDSFWVSAIILVS
jgi:hypothetical protein